jgi:hypothetical protein
MQTTITTTLNLTNQKIITSINHHLMITKQRMTNLNNISNLSKLSRKINSRITKISRINSSHITKLSRINSRRITKLSRSNNSHSNRIRVRGQSQIPISLSQVLITYRSLDHSIKYSNSKIYLLLRLHTE